MTDVWYALRKRPLRSDKEDVEEEEVDSCGQNGGDRHHTGPSPLLGIQRFYHYKGILRGSGHNSATVEPSYDPDVLSAVVGNVTVIPLQSYTTSYFL
jgi:hypothetical protein